MASRGISLVYSRGDESTRKTLVEALVGVLQVSGGYRGDVGVTGAVHWL